MTQAWYEKHSAAELQNAYDAVDTGLDSDDDQSVNKVSPSEMVNFDEHDSFITPVMPSVFDKKSVCDASESDTTILLIEFWTLQSWLRSIL